MAVEHETERPYPPKESRGPSEIGTTRVRQGEAPGRMRFVLAISILLVALIFAIIYFMHF